MVCKRLKAWEEITGQLRSVTHEDGSVVIEFMNVGHIAIPQEQIDPERLQPYIGKRISILRTDLDNREYLWRSHDD